MVVHIQNIEGRWIETWVKNTLSTARDKSKIGLIYVCIHFPSISTPGCISLHFNYNICIAKINDMSVTHF